MVVRWLLALCTVTITVGMQQPPTSITMIRAAVAPDSTVVRIRAASTLTGFQRPERVPGGFVLRLPGATLENDAIDTSASAAPLRVEAKRIRDILVLTVRCAPTDSVVLRRDGQRDLLCVIQPKKIDKAEKIEEPEDVIPRHHTGSRGKWSLDVIVIDAGHGGKDVGAEGVNGAFEKDVTLAIAKLVRARLAEIMPSTKVVMTRDNDVFIELFRRTQIANDAGGKLFLSIHCNSMPTKPHPAHGCETYILRPGRNDDAARVASRENASVKFEQSQRRYEGMTEDQIIVATMAQRSFVRLSESFAASIQREVVDDTPLEDRGVSQAGFFVLVGAAMPNVLIETGFLSNRSDAEYLASQKGQAAIAGSIASAIRSYAASYQRSLSH
jgi:N-acetylmuramoyl-L-alanine amidase